MDALAECPDIVAGTGKTCIVSNLSYRKRRMFQQFHASADPVFYNIVKDRTVEGPAEKAAAGFPAKMKCHGKLFQQNAAAIIFVDIFQDLLYFLLFLQAVRWYSGGEIRMEDQEFPHLDKDNIYFQFITFLLFTEKAGKFLFKKVCSIALP